MTSLVLIWQDVGYGLAGEVGVVPDGLYPGYGPTYLQERVHPGTQSQLISLHDLGVPSQVNSEGTPQVPQLVHTAPSLSPNNPNKIRQALHGTPAGNTKTQGAGGTEERMDICGHGEDC